MLLNLLRSERREENEKDLFVSVTFLILELSQPKYVKTQKALLYLSERKEDV